MHHFKLCRAGLREICKLGWIPPREELPEPVLRLLALLRPILSYMLSSLTVESVR